MNVSGLLRTVYRNCYQTTTKLSIQYSERTPSARAMHSVCSNKPLPILANVTSSITGPPQFLQATVQSSILQRCGMKIKAWLKRRCKGCYFVRREERLYVMCKLKPRHKQMAMKAKPKKSWILTHATQSPQREW